MSGGESSLGACERPCRLWVPYMLDMEASKWRTHPNSKKTSRLLLRPETWACILNAWNRNSTCSRAGKAELLQPAGRTGSTYRVAAEVCSSRSPLPTLQQTQHRSGNVTLMQIQHTHVAERTTAEAHLLFIVSVSKNTLIQWGIIIDGPLPRNCGYSVLRGKAACCTESHPSFYLALSSHAWVPQNCEVARLAQYAECLADFGDRVKKTAPFLRVLYARRGAPMSGSRRGGRGDMSVRAALDRCDHSAVHPL